MFLNELCSKISMEWYHFTNAVALPFIVRSGAILSERLKNLQDLEGNLKERMEKCFSRERDGFVYLTTAGGYVPDGARGSVRLTFNLAIDPNFGIKILKVPSVSLDYLIGVAVEKNDFDNVNGLLSASKYDQSVEIYIPSRGTI
jgi:hypothetical protein